MITRNLTCFVIYRFRKVRTDPIRLKDSYMGEETRFHHEMFRRDRPDLLSEIKKPNQTESADKQEVERLKDEVADLKDQVANTADDIHRLTQLVTGMQIQNEQLQMSGMSQPAGNKRRASQDHYPIHVQSNYFEPMALPEMGNGSDQVKAEHSLIEPIPLNGQEEHMIANMFSSGGSDSLDVFGNFAGGTIAPINSDSETTEKMADPELSERLREALGSLPKDMQDLMVERMVSIVCDPAVVQAQIDAVLSLATSAATDASMRLSGTGISPKDRQSIALATSILSAYIEKVKERTFTI
jgi:hypothetical protein